MKSIDLSPIMASLIGAEKMFQNLPVQKMAAFPPHNIELIAENQYRITLAVAGFTRDELSVELDGNSLSITGKKTPESEDKREFLHKGIGERDFVKRFTLGEYIEVSGSNLEHGLLTIDLKKNVPDEKQPRVIEIG